MWKVPLFSPDLGPEEAEAASEVVRSGWLTMGGRVAAFEEALADHVGVKHAVALSSCTASLFLATKALGVGPGDEVVCPSLTFVASAGAMMALGARPVFADISDNNLLTPGPAEIEAKLTDRTKAINIMHYAGFPAQVEGVRQLAQAKGIPVVEDCAHAHGAELNGKRCGSFMEAGAFSFFSNKNMTTGEGGAVTTNNADLAASIRSMRSHGMTTGTWQRHNSLSVGYDVLELGFNFRLDEIRAAIGLAQLGKLAKSNARRAQLVEKYKERLSEIQGLEIPLAGLPGKSANHIFVVLLDDGINRERVIAELHGNGIQTSVHYPPIHLFSYYRETLGAGPGELERTEDAARRLLTLPLFPTMSEKDVETVCDALAEALSRG